MPYIKTTGRSGIDTWVNPVAQNCNNAGDLNYALTRIVLQYILAKGLCYETLNSVAGVLYRIQSENDRRITDPYEDVKITENGDVPEYAELQKRIAEMRFKQIHP